MSRNYQVSIRRRDLPELPPPFRISPADLIANIILQISPVDSDLDLKKGSASRRWIFFPTFKNFSDKPILFLFYGVSETHFLNFLNKCYDYYIIHRYSFYFEKNALI